MTGWDWCKQVFDPEIVGYYNVSGNRVAFTTKAGKHHDLQVDDFADVEYGKALVYAKIGGKVPPVKLMAVNPELDAIFEAMELPEPEQPKVNADELDKQFDELVEEANKPVAPKKPPHKKALPK